jgi:hypothetical protein
MQTSNVMTVLEKEQVEAINTIYTQIMSLLKANPFSGVVDVSGIVEAGETLRNTLPDNIQDLITYYLSGDEESAEAIYDYNEVVMDSYNLVIDSIELGKETSFRGFIYSVGNIEKVSNTLLHNSQFWDYEAETIML